MATPNFAKKNPFMGMTVAQMKSYYDKKVRGKKLSASELKRMADQMQAAKKAAPKAKPAAPKPAAPKPAAPKPRQLSKEEAMSRFLRSSSGTRGEYRKSGDPGPAVLRRGSTTGASVDPRERQLRKNRQEAARRRLRGNTNRRGRRS